MNTKRLKRRLIKAIYKMNPKDANIRGYVNIQIAATEKIGKKIFMRYRISPEISCHHGRIELNNLSLMELVYIYESLKEHDTKFRIFRPW